MELNTQIKKYRTNMNLTQEELAEKVYVTRQTISNSLAMFLNYYGLLITGILFIVTMFFAKKVEKCKKNMMFRLIKKLWHLQKENAWMKLKSIRNMVNGHINHLC